MKIKAKIPPLYPPVEWKPGQVMEDGSIYLGFYGDKDWFAAASDLHNDEGKRLTMTFKDACAHVKTLKLHGHTDWTLPPGQDDPSAPNIAKEIYRHAETGAFKGSFLTREWYWTCTLHKGEEIKARYFEVRFGKTNSGYYEQFMLRMRPVRGVQR